MALWVLVQGAQGHRVQRRPDGRVLICRLGDGLVGDQVGAGTAGGVVFGCGDQELARRVQRVGMPSGGEHALAEDQVDVAALADAEAHAHVHLRAERALAHRLLGRPLGGRNEGHRDSPAAPGDVRSYDPTTSRRHAELALAPNGVQVRDLGSSNGTFLNGSRITEATGVDGDVVAFGKVAFHVREVTPPGARPAVETPSFGAAPLGATIMRPVPVAETPLATGQGAGGAAPLAVEGASLEERRARRLAVLLDISKELSRQQDVDNLLHKVVDITFQVMNVDRVSILMAEPGSDELIPRVSHNRLADEAVSGGSRHVPRSIARKAVEERLAILTDNAATDERFKGKSIVMQSVRSAMCAPLMGHDAKVLGIIYVDNLTATHSFGDEDLEFLIAFSGIASVSIENSQLTDRIRREAVVLSNFQRYFAPNVAAQIASEEGSVKLGSGEKKPVFIFFSDIRGFTTISEGMDPRELSLLMNEFLTPLSRVVYQHHGKVDKYMGDCIMAFWGAPLPDSEHAKHAILAGLQMQQALQQLQPHFRERGWPEIHIGVGINTGKVSVGNMGSEVRVAYTVMGDAVNLASRLEGITKQYGVGIIVGESTRETVPDFVYRELDHVRVKGKDKPVAIYEPLGLSGKVDKAVLEELKLFHHALRLYRKQDWEQAELQFYNLQRMAPESKLYQVYAERIGYFRKHPPAADWDGVFVFETK